MARLHMHLNSRVLGMPITLDVILPQYLPGTSNGTDNLPPYKALYLLHGMEAKGDVWLRRTNLEHYTLKLPMAVIMPSCQNSWYADMVHGRDYYTFVAKELPDICETMFPIMSGRENRSIGGFSMGGYGAMKIGLLESDSFSAVISIAGALLNPSADTDERNYSSIHNRENIFGKLENMAGSDNDVFAVAARQKNSGKKLPQIFSYCGRSDFLFETNNKFAGHLNSLGIPLTYEVVEGNHDYATCDRGLKAGLDWLGAKNEGSAK